MERVLRLTQPLHNARFEEGTARFYLSLMLTCNREQNDNQKRATMAPSAALQAHKHGKHDRALLFFASGA